MDRINTLLLNARERLGCSGLRNLGDLSQMRQETLEKRFTGAQHRLTVRNTLSIYTAWLWEKAFAMAPKDLHQVIEKWCMYLWGIGCTREMARVAWTQAQTMLGSMPVTRSAPQGTLHMKIGSSITNQFPTVPSSKRNLAVLEESADSDEHGVARTGHHAPSPCAKRHKSTHVGSGMNESPFRLPVPEFPPPVPFGRQDYLSLSPRTKIVNSHCPGHAARRTQEKSEPPWRQNSFKFNFGHPPRPSVGGSHWSPRQDAALKRSRRVENRPYAEMHRRPAAIKMEDRSPTPPPRVVSVGDGPAPPPPQMQKQMHKQSWQISNVQSQLSKQAKTSAPQAKAIVAPKMPDNSTKEVFSTKIGQSSTAKDDDVVEIQKQPTSVVAQAKPNKAPLPVKPAVLDQTAVAANNQSLSHFGMPEGVLKPANKENRPPDQSCIPSALVVTAQHSTQPHAQFHAHYHAPVHPPYYSQHYAQHFAQHQAFTLNSSGARVAPYPRMHNSPLPQQPMAVAQQGAEKPLVGYHPNVTRLFRRRSNVWVRQANRDVALDTWGDFSDPNRPQEYWHWEDYDPFNPLV
ncbi:hypothetical protein LLEC1_00526 [Akanthomyces lecanii]|uniref:Uncharacterized protein n=1 Tax=Cordyceps confragosa TaxID=2714763 RepID=A0A179I5P3_CORDF|nr:hypothetical protein LLEC1_00526 [Akanthomyces lecanii]